MRARLRKCFPIVLIALVVQIFAPIGATWAATIAASDPAHAAVICHSDVASAPDQSGQTGQHRAHDGCCAACSVLHTGAPLDAPQTAAVTAPYFESKRVVWFEGVPDLFGSRAGSHAQARAPPQLT
jgi:hypothetical protein